MEANVKAKTSYIFACKAYHCFKKNPADLREPTKTVICKFNGFSNIYSPMFYFLILAIASFASSWIRPWIYGDNAIIIKVNNIFLPLCLWEQGISGNYSKCINKFLFQIYVNEYALMNQIVRQRKLLKGHY